MQHSIARPAQGHLLDAIVDLARRGPGKVLVAALAVHLLVWTVLPILVCPNLQLDLVEDLALGKEWQLGYWKHPPLPWWIADLSYRITGQIAVVYVLGPLAAVACFYGVWLLGRDIVGPFRALAAVLILEGVHFYNFSVVKFAHDQVQLPFWAFAALFFYRALSRGRIGHWALAGAFLAGAFWSKYAAVPLAVTFGLVLLLDPFARPSWRTAGPWTMALSFIIVIAPNAWWLVDSGFLPFQYVSARAKEAAHWYEYLLFPLQWTGSQIFFLLPAVALLGLLYSGRKDGLKGAPLSAKGPQDAFGRRYLAALALGPFAVTTLVAAVLGRLPVAMWGYPLWSFAPLAAIAWLGPVEEARELRRLAGGIIAVAAGFAVVYAAIELFEPLLRNRGKASQFPGAATAARLTQDWHERFGTPLAYVCGDAFIANNVAVYSEDRPHVVVNCDTRLSPWIDPADLRRRGVLAVWEVDPGEAVFEGWRAALGELDVQPAFTLPRLTLRPVPVRIVSAIAAPRP